MNGNSGAHLVEIVAALKEITARITSAASLPEAVADLLKITTTSSPATCSAASR